jgi:hypothetical protein
MGTDTQTKLNHLMSHWPDGMIYCTSWLNTQGYSSELIHKYKKSHWITPLGSGAYKKHEDRAEWMGALSAVQSQLQLKVHLAGKSALELLGKAQYLSLKQKQILISGNKKEQLPAWFRKYNWGVEIKYQVQELINQKESDFGTKSFGYTKMEFGRLSIILSSAELAYLEYLDELPKKYSYLEALEILENLPALRSQLLQNLLENCKSIKVKRLFLHLAKKVNHPWFKKLDLKKINLGTGKRVIFPNGILDPEYLITFPKGTDGKK